MVTETDLQRLIQLDLSGDDVRIFRNSVGEAWHGSTFSIVKGRLVRGVARRVMCGLGPGTSDLIGLRSVIVTPSMVGARLSVFIAIEVKSEEGRATAEQRRFANVITELGGIAGFARSVEDARRIVAKVNRC